METYKLNVKLLKQAEEIETKEYEIIVEPDGNIRCTCEHSSLFPEAYLMGEPVCSHIALFIKLPGLFEKQWQ